MQSTDYDRSGGSPVRWIAADYARLIGLRTVPGGLFLLGFTLLGSHVGHFLPVLLQATLTYGAGVAALLVTAEVGIRYRRTYGSVLGIDPPRIYRLLYGFLLLGVVTLLLQRLPSIPSWPYWFLGAVLIFWALPFEGGGLRRVRWHWVGAALAVGVTGTTDIHIAIPMIAFEAVIFGLFDHLLFVRRFPMPHAEPADV